MHKIQYNTVRYKKSLYEGMDIQSSNLVTVFSTGSNHSRPWLFHCSYGS